MKVLTHWALLVLVIYPVNSFSRNNATDTSSTGRDSSDASNGIHDPCLVDPTFSCIQKRLVHFLDRLSKVKAFSVLGDWIFVVKVNETSHNITERFEGRMESDYSKMFGKHLESFFNTHVIRLSLPEGIKAKVNGESRDFGTTLDISLGRAIGEARKKVKLKHMMSMMMSGLMSKAAMMGPLLMMIVKIKAFKALVLSTLALLLSKIQLFKMLMKGKGGSKEVIILHESHGGGGGGHGGGGGGHGGGGWSSGGESWSSGSEGHETYLVPNDNGLEHGGTGHRGTTAGFGGGGGRWPGVGGGGYGGGAGSWASASGDSYSSSDGGHGGGAQGSGGGGGWGSGWASRNYDPTWMVYRTNKTDSKQLKRQ